MKRLSVLITLATLLVLLASAPIMAQQQPGDPGTFGAAGIAYLSTARPNLQGWMAFGVPLNGDDSIISYTNWDVAPVPVDETMGFTVAGKGLRYSIRTGIAYRLLRPTDSWTVYGLVAPGLAVTPGVIVLGSFEYGAFLHKTMGRGLGILLALTAEKSAGQPTDFAPRIGITWQFK
jgi:hypothetical protein